MSDVGSVQWFIETEQKYGGYISGIPRRKYSEMEQKPAPDMVTYMIGGDRMSPEWHNYAPVYAWFLRNLIERREEHLVIVELGVLTGIGLALWSELFPNSDIIGLDLDIGYVNVDKLKSLGAFPSKGPELYVFDQWVDGQYQLTNILGKRKIDLMIDDGCHQDQAIIRTFDAACPFLQDEAIYIVEDNWTVAGHLSTRDPSREVIACGKLSVVRKRCVSW